MILLDTNVISAVMQPQPAKAVTTWFDQQAEEDVWTTTISVFEVRFRLACLEQGRRRRDLEEAFQAFLDVDISGKIAAFDLTAAGLAADLAARRRSIGRPVEYRDTWIGGIALARRASIATRNVGHFDDLGVPIIDPWAAG
jgi:toxin FitB